MMAEQKDTVWDNLMAGKKAERTVLCLVLHLVSQMVVNLVPLKAQQMVARMVEDLGQ